MLLRQNLLPVSGKKVVLIDRVKTALLDHTHRPRYSFSASTPISSATDTEDDPRSGGDGAGGSKALDEQSGDGNDGNITTPVTGGGSGDDSGSGAAQQGTLRERLQERVRAREAAREAEAEASLRTSKAPIGTVVSRKHGGQSSRPHQTGDGDRPASRQGKTLNTSSRSVNKDGGTGRPIDPTPIRRPLGALGQGNARVRGNNGTGKPSTGGDGKEAVKARRPKEATTISQPGTKSQNVSGSGGRGVTGSDRKRPNSLASRFSKSAGGGMMERPRPVGVSAPAPKGTDGGSGAKNGFSERGGGGELGARKHPGGAKTDGGGPAVTSLNHAKRVRVESGAKATTTTPSFLKPTKSSGAHVSAGLQARSNGGGGGAADDEA